MPSDQQQIPSRESVLKDSWSLWLDNVKTMQLTDSQETPPSVDNYNRMLSCYSCKRQTNRLSLIILSKMIDISALNAYHIFMGVNPKWNPNGRKEKRRDFFHELGLSLVGNHAATRPRIARSLLQTNLDFVKTESESDDIEVKKKRCKLCVMEKGSKSATKTGISCATCKTFICRKAHSTTICNVCYKNLTK